MSAFLFWRGLFWISYVSWIIFETWVFSRDRRRASGERRDSGSLYVLWVMLTLGICVAFTAPFYARFAHLPFPPRLMAGLGIALMWIGLGLRYWAIRTLGRFFRYKVVVQDEHRLVTSGPYRLLRHPSYTGALLTLIGVAMVMNNGLSILGILACGLIGYSWRIRVEERALGDRFGAAFEQNCRRTWAVIPLLW